MFVDKTKGPKIRSTEKSETFQIKDIVGHMDDTQLERIAVAMVYATPIVMKAFDKGVQFTNTFEKISKTT